MTMIAVGLLDVSAVLTNGNTESSRQHYLLRTPTGQACGSDDGGCHLEKRLARTQRNA
jgi:hypothetical protein